MQRYMRGMGNGGAIRARGNEPLALDAIRASVPSVFAEQPHDSRSERYAYIPTSAVLAGLQAEGFQPFYAQQGGSRIPGKADFTKHVLRLRHQSRANERGEAHEIILLNSHDGTSSFQLFSGVFRFVCMNGLFVGDLFTDAKVQHKGDVKNDVIEAAYTVLEDADAIMDGIEEKKAITLHEGERLAFAKAAHALRFDDANKAPVTPERLLAPARHEDQGRDLWTTFNVVQERVIRGGQQGWTIDANNRRRRSSTREVKGIDQNKALNRAMATLADEMAKLTRQAAA